MANNAKRATIEKLGDFPTSPELLLQMILANCDNAESVVVSVIGDDTCKVYWTQMKNSDLAFHAYCVQRDLMEAIDT